MATPLHVLIVEDSEDDAMLILRELRQGGYDPIIHECVETPSAMNSALDREPWDVVISDYTLPHFSGPQALALLQKKGMDLPFIIVTGTVRDEIAVAVVKAGAHDYVMKDNLRRLPAAVGRELKEVETRRRRTLAEEALKESETRFKAISETANDAIVCLKSSGKICIWNPKAEEMFGYPASEMIGRALHELIVPERYREKAGEGLKAFFGTGVGPVVGKTIELSALHKDGTEFPIELSVSAMRIGGKWEATGIIRDITERKQTEEKLRLSYEKLRRNLEETAGALAYALEKRDAYTAGHARRVVRIACAIARELGLSQDQMDSIRIAGILHDIGKIYIPAEILNKPGKLHSLELSLIQTHAQISYEILKDIEFPWPVVQIVLQHHERMDGSGYPSGLSGDKILMEARILCVSDVVEAIVSHRPYRPALGVDAAIEEITQKRGMLYDPAVVDACVRLFKEKGFKIE